MSKVLRRPMFRGGRVNSRGTGITSGLDRPGLEGGGLPPTGNPRFINLGGGQTPTTMNIGTKSIYQRPIGPPRGGLGFGNFKNLRSRFGFPLLASQGRAAMALGLPSLTTAGIMGAPFLGPAAIAAMNMPKTDEALKVMKKADPSIFDETAIPGMTDETGTYIPGEYEQFVEEVEDANKKGKEISFLDTLFLDPETDTYPAIFGRYEDIAKRRDAELREQIENQTKDNNTKKVKTGGTKETGGTGGDDPKKNIEESLDIDKEKFAKLLGSDKARGQDIADMLLSFSSKALAPEADVKSAFAEFAADEVKRPSRLQKIEDNAAALAINKYIKGEIAKDELNKILALNKAKTDIGDAAYISDALQKSTGFVSGVKQGLQRSRGGALEFVVTDSKSMTEENFKPGPEDIGKIFIEKDTKKVYEFNTNYQPVPIYSG